MRSLVLQGVVQRTRYVFPLALTTSNENWAPETEFFNTQFIPVASGKYWAAAPCPGPFPAMALGDSFVPQNITRQRDNAIRETALGIRLRYLDTLIAGSHASCILLISAKPRGSH